MNKNIKDEGESELLGRQDSEILIISMINQNCVLNPYLKKYILYSSSWIYLKQNKGVPLRLINRVHYNHMPAVRAFEPA